MNWEAIILTGGRAKRLGGYDKASLVGPDGRTCLDRAIDTCAKATQRVVVGPRGDDPRVLWTREEPPYSGPARGIQAGVVALGKGESQGDTWVLVLACDMPYASEGVPLLLQAAENLQSPVDGIVGVADGRRQWLCALYMKSSLVRVCERLVEGGTGESVHHLVQDLHLVDQPIPLGSAQDIDTVEDARTLGFSAAEAVQRECVPGASAELLGRMRKE